MKTLCVRACQLACFVILLTTCIVSMSFAQTTWTVLGGVDNDHLWDPALVDLEFGDTKYLFPSTAEPYFLNDDSIVFAGDYQMEIWQDSQYLSPWYSIANIDKITTFSNNTGEVLFRDFAVEQLPGSIYFALEINQLGEIDNKLKKFTLESGMVEFNELYVSELSFLGNGTSNYQYEGINVVKVNNIAVIDNLQAARVPIFNLYGLRGGNAGILEIGKNGTLIVSEGDFDGIIHGEGSLEKIGKDTTLTLRNFNLYKGKTIISEGRLVAAGQEVNDPFKAMITGLSLGDGETILKEGAVLQVGDSEYSNSLLVGDFTGEGGKVELYINDRGQASSLEIVGNVKGSTSVKIVQGDLLSINRWGSNILKNTNFGDLNQEFIASATFDVKDSFVFEDLETSRYKFFFHHETDENSTFNAWYATASPQDILIPDISTMMLTNIIGFEMPRAQNVNGPWARMKGGQLTDNKSMFNHNSYQTLQVGWDKRLQALSCENAFWNAGMFFEGDWMYGRGDYRSSCNGVPGNITGNLSSTTNGMGAGLYISRSNHLDMYFDIAGRINLFDNKANMNAHQNPDTNNYRANWASETFTLAIELGRNIRSKNSRLTFNPYNQVIYASAPGNDFDVIFADNSIVNVHTDQVSAWTNKLGGLVSINFKNQEDRVNRVIFGSMNYYQGLSGRFSTQMLDTLNPNAEWVTTNAGRPKNNLSYATGIAGFSLFPKENFRLTAQSNLLFGDVSGWSTSLTGSISF